MTTYPEIKDIIAALQDSGTQAYGNAAGHAWGNGLLGMVLADVLYSHVSAAHRDHWLFLLENQTRKNLQKVERLKQEKESVDNAI